MGKTVHRRNISGPLMQTALLLCFLLAFLAQLVMLRSSWLAKGLGDSSPHILYWLRIVADGLTILGCACACVVLSRLVWLMRRQAAFRTAALGLMLVLGVAAAKRLLDLLGYGVTGGTPQTSAILRTQLSRPRRRCRPAAADALPGEGLRRGR